MDNEAAAEFALSRAITLANRDVPFWARRWFKYAVAIAVTDEQRERFGRYLAAYAAAS